MVMRALLEWWRSRARPTVDPLEEVYAQFDPIVAARYAARPSAPGEARHRVSGGRQGS